MSFLRWFSAFREMESALAAVRRENTELRIERDLLRAEYASRSAEVRTLNERLVDEAHKIADTMSLRAIGVRVFSKADPVPVDRVAHAPVGAGRQFARAQIEKQRAETENKLQDLWKSIDSKN